jgi:LAO/AO transport system kinase
VVTCSALTGTGLGELWKTIEEHRRKLTASGELASKRSGQMLRWMWTLVEDRLVTALRGDRSVASTIRKLEAEVLAGRITPSIAADRILQSFAVRDRA